MGPHQGQYRSGLAASASLSPAKSWEDCGVERVCDGPGRGIWNLLLQIGRLRHRGRLMSWMLQKGLKLLMGPLLSALLGCCAGMPAPLLTGGLVRLCELIPVWWGQAQRSVPPPRPATHTPHPGPVSPGLPASPWQQSEMAARGPWWPRPCPCQRGTSVQPSPAPAPPVWLRTGLQDKGI